MVDCDFWKKAYSSNTVEREYVHLSSGVDYLEFHYLDDAGNPCAERDAVTCDILECDKSGNVLRKLKGSPRTKISPLLDVLILRNPTERKKYKPSRFSVWCRYWGRKLFR